MRNKKLNKAAAFIILIGIIVSMLPIMGVNAEGNEILYADETNVTSYYSDIQRVAVGRYNTGYITGGNTYISYGNETIGINEGGGTDNLEPEYKYLPENKIAKSV